MKNAQADEWQGNAQLNLWTDTHWLNYKNEKKVHFFVFTIKIA